MKKRGLLYILDAIVAFLKRFPRLKPRAMVEIQSFLNDYKNTKCFLLAPIEVEILMSRGSGHKIATDCFASSAFSLVCGTTADEIANVSAPKNKN